MVGFGATLMLLAATARQPAAQEVAGIKVQAVAATATDAPRYDPPQWGIGAVAVRTIHGLSFQESDSSVTFTFAGNTNRFRTGGGGFLWFDAAVPDLPAGAQLVGLELEGCDTNASTHVLAVLFRIGSPAGPNAVVGSVDSGDPAAPGCAFFGGPANLPAGQFVDNVTSKYFVRVELGATDPTTSLGAVRIYYKLRVSPAPGSATFNDVPVSNPFFQFVEALVASGITGGCGGGNYCPDAPVTRGQMAVFLSVALGLHFPF
jgi:hypothetical protein